MGWYRKVGSSIVSQSKPHLPGSTVTPPVGTPPGALPFTPTYSVSLRPDLASSLSTMTSAGWIFDLGPTPATTENITLSSPSGGHLVHKGGGYVNSSHYARAKRKLPETDGVLPTGWFRLKVDAELMANHYTVAEGYMRVWGNTDNFRTPTGLGAKDANEWRVSLQMWSDQKWHLISEHETVNDPIELWTSTYRFITPGRHTVEIQMLPRKTATGEWHLIYDGAEIAGGINAQTAPTSLTTPEIAVTRINCGIDGAAPQDHNLLTIYTYRMDFDSA